MYINALAHASPYIGFMSYHVWSIYICSCFVYSKLTLKNMNYYRSRVLRERARLFRVLIHHILTIYCAFALHIMACDLIKIINFYRLRHWLRHECHDAKVNSLSFKSDLSAVLTVRKRRHIRVIIRHRITVVPPETPYRRRFAVFQSNWICRVNSTQHLSRDISHGHAIYRVRTGTASSPQRFMPFNKSLVTEKCRATNVRSESTSWNAPAPQRH